MAGIDDKVQAYLNGGVTRSYGLRRTNYMPIDKSSIWETYEMAAAYAANDNPNTNYCPYAGQIITVLDTNDIYKICGNKFITPCDHFVTVSYISGI